jgi:hypothetical protein
MKAEEWENAHNIILILLPSFSCHLSECAISPSARTNVDRQL